MNITIYRLGEYMRRLKPGPKIPIHAVDMSGFKSAYEEVGRI